MFLKKAVFYLLFFIFFTLNAQESNKTSVFDSLEFYQSLAEDQSLDLDYRIKNIKKAIYFANISKQDTTILKTKRLLATLYLNKIARNEMSSDSIYDLNHQNLKLAKKIKDTLALAYINNVLGWYHNSNYRSDSAYYYYYNTLKYFSTLKMVKDEARTLNEMATIQFEERDYVGCENTAARAIKLYENMPETEFTLDNLWALYNLIAISADELKLYDQAVEYHNKALFYSNKLKDNNLYTLYSNSNIALIYKELGQYDKALKIYQDLFDNKSILKEELYNYALILGDYAHLKYLIGNYPDSEIKNMLYEAYKISDSIQEEASMMSVALNASEYYLGEKELDSASFFSNIAYNLGKKSSTNDVILSALMLKSKIDTTDRSEVYLNEYIKLNDSLVNKERAIRNKFARIELETDQLELKNQQITRERMWLLILSGGLLVTLILLYIIISQRAKNKELKLVQQQQEANEEIYNLMLSQQDKIDEARSIEKKRISEELHDGILGRLFGTRLSLDSLNLSTTDEAIKTREGYIVELKNIEQEIRKVSHELNTDFVSGSGYEDIISTLVETQSKAYGFNNDISIEGDIVWEDIPNKTKIHIYRIIQESLQNIYKHANATHVEISFKLKNNVICLFITDNGSGFDVNKAKKGIGIKNMHSRVKEIHGELEMTSEKDVGTSILIKIPI
ncbi:tetratricopeptide repeat-containing sensor histidine kinase [Hanstruepera ponticola]|uniref:tetratricopeptide repeat-containing sensor histidine kinase n=1 Tax=Hanstruepera ponticola TaxID=2042995 RepID=UPI000CF171AF|nr:tetratricopeptide repeat-containing sensor histidine kinase [Hanstruepera ponticola]